MCCVMVGLVVIVFVLHLAAALLAKKRPRDRERYVTMFGFLLLVPGASQKKGSLVG